MSHCRLIVGTGRDTIESIGPQHDKLTRKQQCAYLVYVLSKSIDIHTMVYYHIWILSCALSGKIPGIL